MEFRFSDRISTLQPSAIREILKNSDPTIIPFSAGNPSVEAFPIKEIENISNLILADSPTTVLQYSISDGYGPLREAVMQFVAKREPGLATEQDSCLIVSGAQQGIDLTAKCLLNEGDTVLCETPSFIGALNTLRSYNVKLTGIPMEEDGIDLAQLEAAMKNDAKARLLYVIPNFQNPSGLTMSLEKRKAVYELARKYHVVILEDNPYGDLRFAGSHIPAIKTFDTEGLVVYCGSFSKIIAPGLRVGYAIADQALIGKMVVAKQCSDVHTPNWCQMLCERFLRTCNMQAHLASLQKLYAAKAKLMLDEMAEHFGGRIAYTRPEGGLFIWCTLPDSIDMMEFCRAAVARKVAVVPGTAFLVDTAGTSSSFRVNFSTPSYSQISEGIAILGEVARDFR